MATQPTICVPNEYPSFHNGTFLLHPQTHQIHTQRSPDCNLAAASKMAWDLIHGASISVLVLLSVSVFLTLCLIVIAMCFSRRASGTNFELQERGEGQGGRSEHQSHVVDDTGESQGSRVEHRGQEDHPDLEGHIDLEEHSDLDLQEHRDLKDHQGQDGHQSRTGHRNDDNTSPSELNRL